MSWRKSLTAAVVGCKAQASATQMALRDLESRFMHHVGIPVLGDRVKIEYNPINSMYQWDVTRTRHNAYYNKIEADEKPYAEGRCASYQEALDAVIFHEARHRLGLPTKPNGVTKNY